MIQKLLALLRTSLLSVVLPVALIAGGVLAVKVALSKRVGPAKAEGPPPPPAVRVVRALATPLRPVARGYGVVAPQATWRAVAEVSGRLITVRKALQDGAVVDKDEVLVVIDPSALELARAQSVVKRARFATQLEKLAQEVANTTTSLGIEQRSLKLAQNELDKQRDLLAKKIVSQTVVDKAERDYRAQESKTQSLTNALKLTTMQRTEIELEIELEQANLARIDLDIRHATIRAPFRGRAWGVAVEPTQFVKTGEVLLQLDGMAVAEVTARISIDRLLPVVRALELKASGKALGALRARFEQFREGLDAKVLLRVGERESFVWPARYARVEETLDLKTRTVGFVVVVDDPYAVKGATRPPLTKGMFCEVELTSKRPIQALVVPAHAVEDGHVQVVAAGERLARRAVTVAFEHGELAVISAGLKDGERVVVGDLLPALEGMRLAPQIDAPLERRMREAAAPGASK